MALPMASVSKAVSCLATFAAILKSGEGDYDNAPLGLGGLTQHLLGSRPLTSPWDATSQRSAFQVTRANPMVEHGCRANDIRGLCESESVWANDLRKVVNRSPSW